MTAPRPHDVIWQPMPGPQTALIQCPVFEVFYGGARGGGKTEGSLGDWLEHSSTFGEGAVGVFFRRTFKQLEEVVARTQQIYPKIGAKWNAQRAEWTMPGGGRLKFRYLERDVDAEEYQGHSYTRVYVEEVTNFPSPVPINKLRATLRSTRGVQIGMRLTGNPGGPGHSWVKKRYIDPAPRGWKVIPETFKDHKGRELVLERVFIPSRVQDNSMLEENDPFYVARLQQSGSAELVKAWLEGNWDLVLGAYFDCFDPRVHVLPAHEWLPKIPHSAMIFRSFDWGSYRPFCTGWYAVSDGKWELPRGALLKVGELYGTSGEHNRGLKLDAPAVADLVLQHEARFGWPHGRVSYAVADPAIFIRDGGPSIGEQMAARGCLWRPADNKRIPGWEALRARLIGQNGLPMLYFLSTCENTIRTLPLLQHDETKPEDVDTEGEDHAADETRYACMAKPWIIDAAVEEAELWPKLPHEMTLNEHFARHQARRRAEREGEVV